MHFVTFLFAMHHREGHFVPWNANRYNGDTGPLKKKLPLLIFIKSAFKSLLAEQEEKQSNPVTTSTQHSAQTGCNENLFGSEWSEETIPSPSASTLYLN